MSKSGLAIQAIDTYLASLMDILAEKNLAYGNSVYDPVCVFSENDPEKVIRVRIDDKLSRISRGVGNDEDSVTDLVGYLVLLKAYPIYKQLLESNESNINTKQ